MASGIYNAFKKAVLEGSRPLADTGTPVYVALVTNSYTPDFDLHDFFDDVTNEVVGTAYTAGGVALSSPNVQQNDTTNQGILFGTNVVWPSSTISARAAVLYGSTGLGAASDWLIAYIDFTTDQESSSGDFTINWNASGILALT